MSDDAPEVYTVPEFAALLRLKPKSVYAMIEEGRELPGLRRIGRAIRFHRATVLAWLAGQEAPRPSKARTP